MQIKKNNSSKKKIVIIVVVALVVLGGGAAFAYNHINKPAPQAETSDQVKQADSDKQQSKNLQENPSSKTETSNSDKPADPTTSSASSKKQVQMTASTDTSNGTIFIRGGINYPVIGGSCYAQLSGPSSQSIRKDTTVLQNPASTDCKTISIPSGELSPGKWTFTLHYTSDDYEGASNEVSFSV